METVIKVLGSLMVAALLYWGIGALIGHREVVEINGAGFSFSVIVGVIGFVFCIWTVK